MLLRFVSSLGCCAESSREAPSTDHELLPKLLSTVFPFHLLRFPSFPPLLTPKPESFVASDIHDTLVYKTLRS